MVLSMDNLEQLQILLNQRNSEDTLSYLTDTTNSLHVILTQSQLATINEYVDLSDLDSISSFGSAYTIN